MRLAGHSRPLWLCVFDSLEHAAPMVLLTTHKADTPEAVLGVLATYAQPPGAETALRAFELLSQRLIKPLQKAQFWGYALTDGLPQALPEARRLLNHIPGFGQPPPPDPQLPLFGIRA